MSIVCCLCSGVSGGCVCLVCDLETSKEAGLDTMWSIAPQ